MKVVIIEDEKPALEKLVKTLQEINTSVEIVATLQSIEESLKWLKSNPSPDLIFMDIALSDGNSFEILQKTDLSCPIIFTTAFDHYWQKAFEFNSIDYLLKPIQPERLKAALEKYEQLKQHFSQDFNSFLHYLRQSEQTFKQRILVKKGIDFMTIKTDDIAYFYTEHKIVFLIEKEGNKYIVDKPLSDLETELDPKLFFRLNRQFMIHINAVEKFKPCSKGKIQVFLQPSTKEPVIVSQENAGNFKEWLNQ